MYLHSKSVFACMCIVTQKIIDVGVFRDCCYGREIDVNENYSTIGCEDDINTNFIYNIQKRKNCS